MATKKTKTTKKKGTGKELVTSEPELQENNLSSAALASLANYNLEGVEGALDVTENKELFSNDIVIPKVWLTQTMSDLRKEGKSEEGDFVDSRSEEVLLSINSEKEYMPIIPMKLFKRWQTFRLVKGGKREFVSSEVMKLGTNHNLPYEETVAGDKPHLKELLEYGKIGLGDELVRRQVISAYVLLGEDAQKAIVKPYVVDFAATSKGAGRNLVSDVKTLNAKKMPSWISWFKLGRFEESNDDGDYYVKSIKFGGLLPETMLEFLKDAYQEITSMIDNNTIEIDDRDLHDAAKTNKAKEDVTDKATAVDAGI